jgi:competence protein ComEA
MERTLRAALSRVATRVVSSRFAKPIARVALAAAGLVLLAFIGRTAIASAVGRSAAADGASAHPPQHDRSPEVPSASLPSAVESASPPSVVPTSAATATGAPRAVRATALPDDPVVLNTATDADLRRLPGIGPKRADAILALRAHLGRFHALEDLLKVKGIGRATLKRLRPLIRLEPSPPPDAGPASEAPSQRFKSPAERASPDGFSLAAARSASTSGRMRC